MVLYVDFKLDESYTPSKISIRAGDGFQNLKVSQTFDTQTFVPVESRALACKKDIMSLDVCISVLAFVTTQQVVLIFVLIYLCFRIAFRKLK